MLDTSDTVARKCAYYKGQKDMAVKVYMELGGELGDETMKKIFALMTDSDKEYANFQHKYIDSIGGNKALKV